jgi:1,3-beta-glucanosyltransferase GAS1
VSASVDEEDYGDLFGTVCGLGDGNVCAGIAANASTGDFGAYGMCNDEEKLSFVFDRYYVSQNQARDACDFQGAAKLQDPQEAEGECAALLDQAGEDGTGNVDSRPQGGDGGEDKESGAVATSASLVGALVGALAMAMALL